MNRTIVTGAAGFIGSALVNELMNRGNHVVAVDIRPLPQRVNCKTLEIDVSKTGALDEYLDAETTIFHMASLASVPGSVQQPREDFKNSLYGLFEILESARKYKSRVIFPSTASIFDPSNDLPVSEKAYVKPSSPYAAAKAAGEAYCAAYNRCYDLDIRIARMFSVYGVGMQRFAIHDIIRKIQKDSKQLVILGDGNQIRDYLYIDDAVRGLLTIAEKGMPGEDYNLATGIPVRIYDLAVLIAKLMNCSDIKISPTGKSFPGDVPKWYADISKVKQLDFEPKVQLEDGIKKTIEWIEKN